MRKIISLLLRVSISIGILLFLLKKVDLSKIIHIISSANQHILVFVLLLVLFIHIIIFLRWKILLTGVGLNPSRFLIFKSFCLGICSNLFFPSTIGGDLLRSFDLGMRTQEPRKVIASIILDRLSGYSALVTVALLALLIGHKIITDIVVFFVIGAISGLFLVIMTILFNNYLFSIATKLLRPFGKIGHSLGSLHSELYNFRNQKRIITKNFVYSIIAQLVMSFSVYLISLSLGVKISAIYFFILVPIISTISALPISIAGFGLREASSMYFFTKVGMSGEAAVSVAFLSFLMFSLLALSGGIIYVLSFSLSRRLEAQT